MANHPIAVASRRHQAAPPRQSFSCRRRWAAPPLLQSDEVEELRELHQDLARLLDLLPVAKLGLTDDFADLLALASHQCHQFAPTATAERVLKARVLALMHGDMGKAAAQR
jgi:hypothetical protein